MPPKRTSTSAAGGSIGVKRGRPPGSKNRPKVSADGGDASVSAVSARGGRGRGRGRVGSSVGSSGRGRGGGRPPVRRSAADASVRSSSTAAATKRRRQNLASAVLDEADDSGGGTQEEDSDGDAEEDSGSDAEDPGRGSDSGSEEEAEDDDEEEEEDEESSEEEENGSEVDDGRAREAGTARRLPSEKVRLRRWRRVGNDERDAVTSEAGAIWRVARPIIASLPTGQRDAVTQALTRALSRTEEALQKTLVPPTAPLPQGVISTTPAGGGSLQAWRNEMSRYDDITDLAAASGDALDVEQTLGAERHGDVATLESLLLPEAVETVALTRALDAQTAELQSALPRLKRLKDRARERPTDSDGREPRDSALNLPRIPSGAATAMSAAQDRLIVNQLDGLLS
ncbi:hypothetical protein IE81DRAFT_367161 [Ceraceosorus guamensis]|uniref:Uncharacterized protein n=1 Tax=Ceraceosorus guamensis TaxID=1522189 RepID=A0A316VZG2_9BASI|nr:hypothetical protein IE81DRAFT_367161 [Ceraceosorus guamensis]PWN41813.1 hypothetical protein IE81DRAFT_367161 [Ceraceosorus guamensis]